ncbi:MAG TPA: lipid IV(A) 3-deoxy-D-manno-octulosonic acid transferase [Woeseiaceae bacterium]|nr:lipid IV(A) 3-deoxy-D-manno-octulosonic acid transferase [Woeseiaceae bacterium]
MRFFYNLLTYLLYVPYVGYWLIRGITNRSYLQRIGERLGIGYPRLERCIWIHAVSVGEVVAAVPLIRALGKRYPERPLLVTTVTPTGAARVASLFGDDVHHTYIPFEAPHVVNRFFSATRPDIALVLETEIWPNLYRGCGVRDIPLVLVSARISPRSVRSYRRLLPLFRETLSHGIIIAAQSEADAERFLSLGAAPERTRVTGNIKFDVELAPDLPVRGGELRADLFGDRPVWIAASTHEGEEEIVLDAQQKLLQDIPGLLLVLVPRHPQRFPAVRDMVAKKQMSVVSRTDGKPCNAGTQVFLGDTMGELTLFYAASDVAFVGGSLVPVGGHNLLEPAALGLPLVSGPHVFNAQEIAAMFVDKGACTLVNDADELAAKVGTLLTDPEMATRLGDAGRGILERNRGALARLMAMIEPLAD